MIASPDNIERAAFAIYRTFIAGGVGTCQWKRGGEVETPDEAADRRWRAAPDLTRERFRHEAVAAIKASEDRQ